MKTRSALRTKELVSFIVILIALIFASIANAQTYGAPLFTEDFGTVPTGTANPLNYRVAITGRGTIGSAYTFNPTDQTNDGKYALTPDPTKIHSTAWIDMEDHTANDVNGLMLVVNAALTKGLFYKRAVTGLCYNSQFEFKAYYANVLHELLGCSTNRQPINIRFEIWSVDPGDLETNSAIAVGNFAPNGAKLLAAMNTGDVAATSQTQGGSTKNPTYTQNSVWKATSLIFNVPQSTDGVFLVLRNNGDGGCGNDLAIDDITFSPYIPFTVGYDAITKYYCSGNITLQGTLASGSIPSTIPYVFQWQVADKGTTNWTGIDGRGIITSFANASIDLKVGDIGNKIYRIISAADAQNFNNTNCSVASGSFDGNSVVIPTGSLTVTPDVCGTNDHQAQLTSFTVSYQGNVYPWTYYYSIDGGVTQSTTVTSGNTKTQTLSITNTTNVELIKIATSECEVKINSEKAITYSIGKPAAPIEISGPNPACAGIEADFSVTEVQGAITYNWEVSGDWSIVSGQGTRFARLNVGKTPIKVTIKTKNACGENTFTSSSFETTNDKPAAPATLTAPDGLCFPSSSTPGSTDILFEASDVPGSQNYNWSWDSPVIMISSQISGTTGQFLRKIILSVPNSVNSFTVKVKTQNGCGESVTAKEVTFTPNRLPAAPTADITQTSCSVSTGTITVTAPTGSGMTYRISGSTNTNTDGIFSGLVPGDYYVTAMNTTGCISPQSEKMTIHPVPQAPVVKVTNPTAVNYPATVDLTAAEVTAGSTAGLDFTYWTDAAATNTYTTPKQASLGTYYIKGTVPGTDCSDIKAVEALIIPQGTTQLSYRFANPRIHQILGIDHFEFDVQLKADVSGSEFLKGNVNLVFNNSTLSSKDEDWIATPVSGLVTDKTISGSNLNIEIDLPNSLAISTTYQTLVTISGKITNSSGIAGIDFNEENMNGSQFYKLAGLPWYASYANPNNYDAADFVDTYVGRVYSDNSSLSLKSATTSLWPGWTQVSSLDWTADVNTSVWDGNADIPGDILANASNLRIHNPATLTIPVNGKLTVSRDSEIRPAKGLIVASDLSGTGSLITGSSSGAGSAKVQRYMTTDRWHIVSSPVSGQKIDDFLSSNTNVATDEVGARGMMDYNPEVNDWNNYFVVGQTEGSNMATGKGFSLRTNANSAVNFEGKLQAGNQSSNNLMPAHWNCVGNPYTSAIGINKLSSSSTASFLTTNASNLDPSYGAIYIWDQPDENNGTWGIYTIISNTPGFGSDAAFDVQQGQAFMVKMNAAATSVVYTQAMQLHNPGLVLKSSNNVWPSIKLEASVNGQTSSTLIAFNDRMTKGLDITYDAGLLRGSADLVIYSRLVEDNGIPFAIQALPANEFSTMIIPLGVESKTGGEVVFSSKFINLPNDCQVILEDKQNHMFKDLSTGDYQTEIEANSSSTDRFQLHTSSLSTGLKGILADNLSAYAVRNIEIRIKGQVSNQAVATLYDVQGRVILVKTLEEGSLNVVHTPNIKTAIYMLSVNDKGKLQRFKIPVNE